MKFEVTTLPVEDIIRDLAESFDVPVKDHSGECTIELPENLGEGYIKGASFDSGVGFMYYNCKFYKDVEIHFSLNEQHPLKFIFCSEGEFAHRFRDNEDIHEIDTYQNIIVSSSKKNGHVLMFPANVQVQMSSLEIIRNVFNQRSNDDYQGLDPLLQELFEDSVNKKEFYYHGNYSIKAADIIKEMNSKNFSGFMRSLYLEGKSLHMLVVQIAQFQGDFGADPQRYSLSKKEIERIRQAAELIKKNLDKNYTVEELAKEVGTNVNKLQEGFKYEFDLTVNKYVQNKKLKAAKDYLINSDKNISEIVTAIGLNSRSYFSKIFNEQYGVSPRYFRKNNNHNHNHNNRNNNRNNQKDQE